ncbi:hypothetical protein AB5I41_20340 [Sphingomonas sp. MMS24-JH45]
MSAGYATGTNSAPLRRIADYRLFRYGGGLSLRGRRSAMSTSSICAATSTIRTAPRCWARAAFAPSGAQLSARRDLGAVLVAQGSVS